jgi:hypothetical protein
VHADDKRDYLIFMVAADGECGNVEIAIGQIINTPDVMHQAFDDFLGLNSRLLCAARFTCYCRVCRRAKHVRTQRLIPASQRDRFIVR